jgi:hypothetical protein
VLALLLLVPFVSGSASAQTSAVDAQQAEQLFQDAKRLMQRGQVDEACAKLETVRRLDGGGGTVLALALCHEKQGRHATALAEFHEARLLAARAQRDDRVAVADEHVVRLEADVSRLTVVTTRATVAGLGVELDGVPVDPNKWNTPLPVDVGAHVVRATAPGQPPREATVVARPSGDRLRVDLEPWPSPEAPHAGQRAEPHTNEAPSAGLDAAPASGGPRATSETRPVGEMAAVEASERRQGQRLAGWLVAGAGGLGLGVGGAFGILTIAKRSDAERLCGSSTSCTNPAGAEADHQSSVAGTVSTIAFAVGGAMLAGGIVLVVTAKSGATARGPGVLHASGAPMPGGGALTVAGAF